MKKTLIALAVLGSIAGVAQAQSSVTIYGKLDQGLRKVTDQKLQLTNRSNSRLGFKGAEDLGGGLSAIFQFENRFFADTGADQGPLFKAQSNVGLKGNFGTVRLGRIYNPVDDISAGLDPFGQDGIGAMQTNALLRVRQNNSIRYDSPNFSGFGVQAIYQLDEEDTLPVVQQNDGYGVSATYNNGPITAAAGWNRVANTNDSDYWNIGGGYAFGPAKIIALYEDAEINTNNTDQKNALIGLAYNIGAGTINASFGRLKTETATTSFADKKLALGYTHNLSKRTSLYANASRTNLDVPTATGEDNINAAEIGVTHNF
ncbi:MAG: porin [Oxalobacteraceae bacterium]|nr:porin [Oxalobacteraceae bacterium]